MDFKNFLLPNKTKLILFGVFLLLMWLANIQGEAFSSPEQHSLLYNYIKPFPFWIIMVYLALPVLLVTIPLAQAGLGGFELPITVVYFYVLSCLIEFIAANYSIQKKKLWRT